MLSDSLTKIVDTVNQNRTSKTLIANSYVSVWVYKSLKSSSANDPRNGCVGIRMMANILDTIVFQ